MTQTEYELYEQWREDYALMYEPNYDEHLEADCKAAFLAGMQAASRAQVVPQGLIDEVVPAIDPAGLDPEKHHCEYALYQDRERIRRELAAAPQPPEANQVELHQIKTAAPVVPQFSKVAKQKLDYLLEAGEEITGYAIENKDGRRGAIDCHGFVYWWNEAAPAQMPEPYAYLFQHKEAGFTTKVDHAQLEWGFEESNPLWKRVGALYTEHQVRQILAQHGIKVEEE